MALPQRGDVIDEIKRTDALLEQAVLSDMVEDGERPREKLDSVQARLGENSSIAETQGFGQNVQDDCRAEIKSVMEVLKKNLRIPSYQRPYKWSPLSVAELLNDIDEAVLRGNKTRYRIGTVILHEDGDVFNVVDGQQRLLTFILIRLALSSDFSCPLINAEGFKKALALDKVSQRNIKTNYAVVQERIKSLPRADRNALLHALESRIEFVVVTVQKLQEAFQLFDSQNARGKRLNPHDLLKAYHLREMSNKYVMERAVVCWEGVDSLRIRDLFNYYLYPIRAWVALEKVGTFTERDIVQFKGVKTDSRYTYGKRVIKAMPCYQLAEPFEAGEHFFGMIDYYLHMRQDVEREVCSWDGFKSLVVGSGGSTGLGHARRLFFCALMCYYDRFGNFDQLAITKICQWAFMIRVDMEHLGFDTINKYAIGDDPYGNYSNCIPMFKIIKSARSHHEIANLIIVLPANNLLLNINNERKRVLESVISMKVTHG